MLDGGKTLQATIFVDDPGAFTMPWTALQRWKRREGLPIEELICAGNTNDYFHNEIYPIPEATTLDF